MNGIGLPLGYLMYGCYLLVDNYWLTILLFTILIKVVLFPLSLIVQKNSVQMVKIQPMLDEAKLAHAGDDEKIAEEQMRIYKENKYSPAMGCLPTLLQIPIILGLINVIYNPLKYLLRLPRDVVNTLLATASNLTGIADMGSSGQLRVVELVKDPATFGAFSSLPGIENLDAILGQIQSLDMNFLGLNLAATPSLIHLSSLLWIPVVAIATTVLMCEVQNRQNVLQLEQGALSKYGVTALTTAITGAFTFMVPAGVGLYWIFSNLISTAMVPLLNHIYNPRKYIDYEAKARVDAQMKRQKELSRQQADKLKANRGREKEDYQRFFSVPNKHIVFYSEKSGFYKYFKCLIEALLAQSNFTLHYVTNDPDDQVFALNEPRLQTYYIGTKRIIPFMMKIESDVVVMTTPDLENYHIKRSKVQKDIEYIYTEHGITNNVAAVPGHALDYYDTIFCVGPHHVEEHRSTERLYGLKKRNLLKSGFGLLEEIAAEYAHMPKEKHERPQILMGPSWQKDNMMDLCFEALMEGLLGHGYHIIVRPHPEYIKRYRLRLENILEKYKDVPPEELTFELDFASNETVYASDLVITDWSSIAQEFSYATKKPSLCINTPMKVLNEDYEKHGIVPLEVSQRDVIGRSVDVADLAGVHEVVDDLLARSAAYQETIARVVDETIYHFGHCGEVGASYIIGQVQGRHPELTAPAAQGEGE